MVRGRAYRRNARQKAIDRAYFVGHIRGLDNNNYLTRLLYKNITFDFDQWALRMASVHCKPCSCHICRDPKGTPTRAQIASYISFCEQLDEL